MMVKINKLFSNQAIATFYLVLMCITILPLEGYEVSYIKVAAMALSPLVFLKTPYISKAIIWGGLYIFIIVISAMRFSSFRASTVIYLSLFLLMFGMFYNLVYKGAFSIDYFIKLLKFIILSYTVCLILQQLMILLEVRYFPWINLMGNKYLEIFRSNSLSMEPAHSARILTVCFFALLKTDEIKNGKVKLREFYNQYKWIIIGFLYSMLTMGSATAIVGLGILSLYFIKRKYVVYIIPLLLLFYFIIPIIDYTPLNRARTVVEATMTGDAKTVIHEDMSASVRVVPLLNTLNELDIFSTETWLGKGNKIEGNYMADTKFLKGRMVGGITEYGLLSYIVSLIFVFSCCVRRFFSLECLIFIMLLGAGILNIYYVWASLMIFTAIKYFEKTHRIEVE
ncbi:hypothetical protein FACS1894160_0090 [Bacteroidia bacterium]|nr:hypothetical protein FACS1894123_03630 [Bacteroidia bacterium]GHV07468.1 hypothetical protein FACS1894160_0090 [Bacteroidia bacterium]